MALSQEDVDLVSEFDFLEELLSEEEVVSASKNRQSIFWSPSSITVITREDIQASGAADLADLLRRVPGFDVYRLKPGYPLLGARSQTDEHNNQVLLLVDGREALLELTGFAFWSLLSIDLSEVERVEVIRGPGSALYGANAFTAVVSVTTLAERPKSGVDFVLSGGEQGFQRDFAHARLVHNLKPGILSATIGAGFEEQLNPSSREEPSLSLGRFHGTLRYQGTGGLDLALHAGMITGDSMIYVMLGDMIYKDALHPWVMAKAALELTEGLRFKSQVYYNMYTNTLHTRTMLRGFGVWVGNVPDIDWRSQTVDAQLQLESDLAEGLLIIGGCNLRYSMLSGPQLLLKDDDELRGALFLHANWQPTIGDQILPVQLTGGLRVDFNDLTGVTISPRVALVYRPRERQSFRVAYGVAFRKPSFLESRLHARIEDYNPAVPEIVDAVANEMSNPDLRNERVSTLEVGWRGAFLDNSLLLSVDLFYALYQDLILFDINVPMRLGLPDLGPNADFQFSNDSPEATAIGGEIAAEWSMGDDWSLWCNLGLHTAWAEHKSSAEQKEPTLRVNLGGRYLPKTGWVADAAVHYVSSYSMRLANLVNMLDAAWNITLGDQWFLVGRLGRKFKGSGESTVEIGLEIRTPLGAPFREYGGIPMPTYLSRDTLSDWGGEYLVRIVTAYLRGSL